MKNLLALTVAVVAAALLSTSSSAGTLPATTAVCTNQLNGFVFTTLECTNKPGALLAECTNKFSLNLAECTKGGCTNKLAADLLACPSDCTNKLNSFVFTTLDCTNKPGALLVDCTNKFSASFAFSTVECTNKSSGLKI